MTEPEITLSDVLDRYPLMYNRDDRGDFTEQDLAQHREINRQWWASLKLDTKLETIKFGVAVMRKPMFNRLKESIIEAIQEVKGDKKDMWRGKTGKENKDSLWDRVRHAYWTLLPYNNRPGQLWYRLKCLVWHRYTTYKPRHLSHQWCDKVESIPHMMFEMLEDFYEKECPGCIQWYGEHGHKVPGKEDVYVMDEIKDLLHWWNNVYLKQDEIREAMEKGIPTPTHMINETGLYGPYFTKEGEAEEYRNGRDVIIQAEREIEEDLNENLRRIINIRQSLWT